MTVHVLIEMVINPTEDVDKVKRAFTNFFPSVDYTVTIEAGTRYLCSEFEGKPGLIQFYHRLREERIVAAARRMLRTNCIGNKITFYLNRQAAYVNHISFCEPHGESPLGPITIEIVCEKPKELIDWLTPKIVKD